MNRFKEKLTEKILLVLFALSESGAKEINNNTFKRYIYLYYLTSSFINNKSMMAEDPINIAVNKGDITIIGYESIMEDLRSREMIDIRENIIIISKELISYLSNMIRQQKGALFAQYKEIQPFVNILRTYNDQYIFTIFFSEPTFQEASARGLHEISSRNSELNKLLTEFKKKVDAHKIDEYDILAYWMDYILNNYYIVKGENNEV